MKPEDITVHHPPNYIKMFLGSWIWVEAVRKTAEIGRETEGKEGEKGREEGRKERDR